MVVFFLWQIGSQKVTAEAYHIKIVFDCEYLYFQEIVLRKFQNILKKCFLQFEEKTKK